MKNLYKPKIGAVLSIPIITLSLYGCGGGGEAEGTNPESKNNPHTQQIAPLSLSKDCNLDSSYLALKGTVTEVYDGDTITVNASGILHKVRLESIDAPEVGQPYGTQSRQSLAEALLHKAVTVAYKKTDMYGRKVGSTYTDSCQSINLNQVSIGMAWFYRAYQCEISSTMQNLFSEAEQNAREAKLGLWADSNPQAPWIYRNGAEQTTPVCLGDTAASPSPAPAPAPAPTPTPAPTPAPAPIVSAPIRSTPICYTGPRGGTYTLTKNGNKNYSGC
ncbi:thermonuclease family protein [Caldimonas tepidiphila]|uniref:thermonuclease family protein n=1 Tax=Caldimonas tepidiphila TaxID=2315841 RepID=UPI003AF38DE2